MMETNKRWRVAGAIVGTVAVAALASSTLLRTVYARQTTHELPASQRIVNSSQIGSISSPDSRVTLRLTFDNGAVFNVTQREGAWIKVELEGKAYKISTQINADQDQVIAKVFRSTPSELHTESVKEGIPEASFELGRRPSDISIGALRAKVEVIAIGYEVIPPEETKVTSRFRLLDDEGGGGTGRGGGGPECCLTCSGVTVCGCRVSGSCGTCCVGTCC